MNGEVAISFADSWLWLIFVGAGLLFILLELILGVETGFDLVFIGSAFILGGLITWPFHSWVLSLIVTAFQRCSGAASTGNSCVRPSAMISTASAARINPISRVITSMPVLPRRRAMRTAAPNARYVATPTTTP